MIQSPKARLVALCFALLAAACKGEIQSGALLGAQATGFAIDVPHQRMRVGDTQQLGVIATMTDGSRVALTSGVTWSLESAATATIEEGRITAIAAGVARVTATVGEQASTATIQIDGAIVAQNAGEQPQGPTPGPEVGPMTGPEVGPSMGPMTGPSAGPMMGPMTGPNAGPMTGPSMGPMTGPDPAPNSGPTTGAGPMMGPAPGPTPPPGDTTPPEASDFFPSNTAADVRTDVSLSVSFDEALETGAVSGTSFTLNCAGAITGTVAYDTNTRIATFTPAGLLPNSSGCTATLTGAIRDVAGNSLDGAPVTWSFTTSDFNDFTQPTRTSQTPQNGAINISSSQVVTVTFGESLKPTSITASSVELKCGAATISAARSYDNASRTITVTPLTALPASETCTLTLTDDITDLADNRLDGAPLVSSFTTAAAPSVCSSTTENFLNGNLTGGTASVRSINGPLTVYNASLGAACNTAWTPPGTLCDEAPHTNSRLISAKTIDDSGATWTVGTTTAVPGNLVVDMGAAKTFNDLRIFQMLSDGKTSHFRFYTHAETSGTAPAYNDAGWVMAGDYVDPGPGIFANLALLAADAKVIVLPTTLTTRYLRFEAYNDGRHGDPFYVEIRAVKAFCNDGPTVVKRTPEPLSTEGSTTKVRVEFDRAMAAATVSAANFTLNCGGSAVTGSVAYDAATRAATFTAGSPVASGTSCTAALAPAITDASGKALNAGETWTYSVAPPQTFTALPTTINVAGSRWLDVASDGSMILVRSINIAPNNHIEAQIYTPGTGWGAITSVVNMTSYSINGVIAESPGTYQIFYTTAGTLYAVRYAGGTWDAPVVLSANNFTSNVSVVSAGGVVTVVWDDTNADTFYARRSNGALWGPAAAIATYTTIGGYAHLSAGSANHVIAAWYNYNGATYETRAAVFDTTAWSAPYTLAAASAYTPRSMQRANGDGAVSYVGAGNTLNVHRYVAGTGWAAAVTLSDTNSIYTLASDTNGDILALRRRQATSDLSVDVLPHASSTWDAPVAVAANGWWDQELTCAPTGTCAVIVMDGSGNVRARRRSTGWALEAVELQPDTMEGVYAVSYGSTIRVVPYHGGQVFPFVSQ